jgi:hypothetical protein
VASLQRTRKFTEPQRKWLLRIAKQLKTEVVVDRDALDRFLFAPDDVVAIVGQDGLVPNVAKYLSGQLTFGINPDPAHYDGVLCAFPPGAVPSLLSFAANPDVAHPRYQVSPRTMAQNCSTARRGSGQSICPSAWNRAIAGTSTE